MVNVMGRRLGTNAVAAVIGHFGVALLYGWVIAMCIFKVPRGAGILVGALLAAPLYGLNYLLLPVGAVIGPTNCTSGSRTMFCLFFSVA